MRQTIGQGELDRRELDKYRSLLGDKVVDDLLKGHLATCRPAKARCYTIQDCARKMASRTKAQANGENPWMLARQLGLEYFQTGDEKVGERFSWAAIEAVDGLIALEPIRGDGFVAFRRRPAWFDAMTEDEQRRFLMPDRSLYPGVAKALAEDRQKGERGKGPGNRKGRYKAKKPSWRGVLVGARPR